ncbi:hypothetical protein PPERSA_03317 [Pseudocohnilembus persalinus]|uniref:B30.2/SPRY domain-containing protein n=1 Tax=Pseudocohnilembus persalinus TaxID=266149 RepID=A0A0V0Q8G1_PSEPJ|nr:hypothetical protein PPERSA_03317 [Pseudocohnilembus persalinus]|eukprot:KRW98486.1 hypothetical protein PPERSA_03317 [Pseudocohnilembus persalinus]
MEKIQQQAIQYQCCNKGGLHEGECLNLICLDKSCKNEKLLCSVCIQDYHSEHQKKIMPVKKFLAMVSEQLGKNSMVTVNSEEILENLEVILQGNLYSLKETVQAIAENIKELEKSIISNFKNLKQKIINQTQMSISMPQVISQIVNGEIQNIQNLQENCQQILDSVKQNNEKIEIEIKPDLHYKKFQQQSKIFQEQLKKFEKTSKVDFEKLGKIISSSLNSDIAQVLTDSNWKFTKEKCSTTITIHENGQKALQTSDGEKRYVLVDQPVPDDAITYQAFKIGLSGWVGVGLAVDAILKPKAYEFKNYTTVGHGAWIISSNQYTWSNSNLEENQKNTSFAFTTGAIVLMKFDPNKKSLEFKLKGGDKITKLKIPKPTQNQKYYVCANLCQNKDHVYLQQWDEKDNF